uniref:Liver-expressed antimicrobial peptide 2 n=1 Tax=Scophthalmus maximus TaxID=52904 RepID=A0A8D3BP50_SCOMX
MATCCNKSMPVALLVLGFPRVLLGSRLIHVPCAVPVGVHQVCAGPLAPRAASGSDQSPDSRGEAGGVRAPRRVARMTPLWRTMNSKPLGAYCQSNYECSTGLCRAGHCSTSQRSLSGAVTY